MVLYSYCFILVYFSLQRLVVLFCFCYLKWGSKYTCFIFMKEEFKWRTMKTGNVKGNPRLKHWANDYPVFWPKRGCWPSKQKQCDWKKPVTEKPFAWRSQEWIKCDIQQTKPGLLRTEAGGRQSWDRSLYGLTVELTADTLRLQMNHVCTKKEFWYRKRVPQSAHGEFSWRKCVCRRRQGYLPKIVTKIYEMPTTFESSVVK